MGFFTNDYVTNITIGGNVKFYGNSMYNAFSNCTNLNSPVDIPHGVTNLAYAFHNCSNLAQNIYLPNTVTNIHYAFAECKKVDVYGVNGVSPNIHGSADYAFANCHNLSYFQVNLYYVNSAARTFYQCNKVTFSTETVRFGYNVVNLCECFARLQKPINVYIRSNNVRDASRMLYYKNNRKTTRVFYPNNTMTNTCIRVYLYNTTEYILGYACSFASYTNYVYNSKTNLYLYYNY